MTFRGYISIGIIILIISSATTIYFQRQRIITLSTEREQLVKVAQDSGRLARTYINLHGKAISKNNVLDLDLRNAKDIQKQELSFLNQFDGVKKNLKNLEESLRIQSDAIISLKLKTGDTVIYTSRNGVNRDSLLARSFHYSDKYNKLRGFIEADSTIIKGNIIAPLTGAIYWKRKHQFIFKNWRYGQKEYFSEIASENPWVKITNHEFIKITKR